MNKISMINLTGEKVKDINLKNEFWQMEPNKSVIHDAIVLANNSLRQGTASTKSRGEVSGGGKRPWRQKGTGRARHGTRRSPLWPGGGIVFGPKPRDYDKKMNRKERRLALKSALAIKLQANEMVILEEFIAKTPKTKDMVQLLKNLGSPKKPLFIVDELTDNIILALRNIEKTNLIEATEINVYDIVNCDKLFITEKALNIIEEVLVNGK